MTSTAPEPSPQWIPAGGPAVPTGPVQPEVAGHEWVDDHGLLPPTFNPSPSGYAVDPAAPWLSGPRLPRSPGEASPGSGLAGDTGAGGAGQGGGGADLEVSPLHLDAYARAVSRQGHRVESVGTTLEAASVLGGAFGHSRPATDELARAYSVRLEEQLTELADLGSTTTTLGQRVGEAGAQVQRHDALAGEQLIFRAHQLTFSRLDGSRP